MHLLVGNPPMETYGHELLMQRNQHSPRLQQLLLVRAAHQTRGGQLSSLLGESGLAFFLRVGVGDRVAATGS